MEVGTPRATTPPGDATIRFRRYRDLQRAEGMKLLRVWVPDPRHPDFAREAERQAKLLRGRPEELEALAFIDAAFVCPEP